MNQKFESPPMRILPKVIEATTFNQARLVLLRVGNPLRVSLKDHRCLDVILSQEQWLCVDSCNNDQPIMAWREFEIKHRNELHKPIDCKLYFYHTHAGLIMGTARDSLPQALKDILHEHADAQGQQDLTRT